MNVDSEFLDLAKKMSRDINRLHLKEDVEQELAEKLVKTMPRILERANYSPSDALRIARSVLRNRITDLSRFGAARKDTSIYSLGSSVEETLDRGMSVLGSVFLSRPEDSEKSFEGKELLFVISRWIEDHKDPEVRLFLSEAIEPSKEVIDEFENRKRTYPRYRAFSSIPPFTLGKILGIKNRKVICALKELKSHLMDVGYENV